MLSCWGAVQIEWIQDTGVAAIALIEKLGEPEGGKAAARFARLGFYGWTPGLFDGLHDEHMQIHGEGRGSENGSPLTPRSTMHMGDSKEVKDRNLFAVAASDTLSCQNDQTDTSEHEWQDATNLEDFEVEIENELNQIL